VIIYLNGKLIEDNAGLVPIDNPGLLQGDGLFETMRAYDGKIFAIDKHMERLARSAVTVGIPYIPPVEELISACRSVVDANNFQSARVRLTVLTGTPDEGEMTVIATVKEYEERPDDLVTEGIKAITLRGFSSSTDMLAAVKSTSYQRFAVARRIAENSGCEEAILINEHGNVSEGSYSNIFAVDGHEIITPCVTDGLLPGITRALVMEIAKENGFEVREQSIAATQIPAMDEVFVTNSLIEIIPVTSIDGDMPGLKRDKPAEGVKDASKGALTIKLRQLYKDYVRKELGI
jgi:branched-subunit amino acid aminotransferase/4-amino-4-deoxychorismate lyase